MEVRPCKITMIDLHHTAGYETSIEVIRDEHMNGKGWGDIGYNAVVFPDGSIPTLVNSDGVVTTGRSIKWSGAHNPGLAPDGSGFTMNQRSYGISHVGNFMDINMSDTQFNSSVQLCTQKCKEFGIIPSRQTIRMHKDDYATECPGDNFPYDRYLSEVIKLFNQGGQKKVDNGVLLYSKDDAVTGFRVSEKFGNCAVFIRKEDHTVSPDVMNVGTLYILGGTSVGHPHEVILSGASWWDTVVNTKTRLGF